MTLQREWRSPKSNQLLSLSLYLQISKNLSSGIKISYIQDYDLENEVKGTKNY